jgi:WD40 repeat protein
VLLREHTWNNLRDKAANAGTVDLDIRPDGGQIAVACRDWRVRLFSPLGTHANGPEIKAWEMRSVAYAPTTGNLLLAIGTTGPGAMRLQDVELDRAAKIEIFHSGNLTSGGFDRSGRHFVTSSEDGTAIVRDSAGGEPLLRLAGHAASVLTVAFSLDDGAPRLITGSADGTARIWPLDPVAAALERQPRALRDDEIAREKRLALPLPYH